MIVIPAIDILDNKVVRLKQGIMEDATNYDLDIITLAKKYEDIGVKRLHIVDLNAAKGEFTTNAKSIENIVKSVNIDLELGGGIRELKIATHLDNLGIKFFIIGTLAVKNIDATKEIINNFPNRVILGLDAKGENIATDGWYAKSELKLTDMVDIYKDTKVESIIYTDILKDGMLEGLNLKLTDELAKYSPFKVIASGGLSSSDDIEKLKNLNNKNIYGVVVGKAIYEGKISFENLAKFITHD